MSSKLDPLPLENRRLDTEPTPGRRPKLSGASIIAHIGMCMAAFCFWIFGFAFFMQPTIDRMIVYQRFSAAFGALSMLVLFALCVAVLMRRSWSRRAMIVWALIVLAWESAKLLINLFVFSRMYKERAAEIIREAAAASTNPATQPSQFAGFVNYGLYIIPIITFLIFGGYAFATWRVMRGERAKAELGA